MKTPIQFDTENCQYEVLEIRDIAFTHHFCKEHLLKPGAEEGSIEDRYNKSELRNLGWPVALQGEFRDRPLALLRPLYNPNYSGKLHDDKMVEQAARSLDHQAVQSPYSLLLCIMPLDFARFWKLIWTRKQTNINALKSQSKAGSNPFAATSGALPANEESGNQNMLEVYRWKLSFDSYRSKLPQYFNDYINSYLKFLQMDQALLLPAYERILFD